MRLHKYLALMMAMIMLVSVFLTGCGKKKNIDEAEATGIESTHDVILDMDASSDVDTERLPIIEHVEVTAEVPEYLAGLDETQRNSIHMLNHLAVLTQQVNIHSGFAVKTIREGL